MFWLFPLMMASSAFAPTASMPGWLQGFAKNQPVSVATDAIRGLVAGNAAGGDIAFAFGWILVMLVIFVPVASRLYAKT